MTAFRKKPVVIDAVQFDGTNFSEIDSFMEGANGFQEFPPRVVILTLEGTMYGDVGDWIIKGVKGEFYPCKPDIFEATYEVVEHATR